MLVYNAVSSGYFIRFVDYFVKILLGDFWRFFLFKSWFLSEFGTKLDKITVCCKLDSVIFKILGWFFELKILINGLVEGFYRNNHRTYFLMIFCKFLIFFIRYVKFNTWYVDGIDRAFSSRIRVIYNVN